MPISHGSQQVLFALLEQTVAAEHPPLQINKEADKLIIITVFAWQYELTQLVSGLPALNGEKPIQGRLALLCAESACEFCESVVGLLSGQG